jgi:hypothetical protein
MDSSAPLMLITTPRVPNFQMNPARDPNPAWDGEVNDAIWQFTSTGQLAGYGGNLDCNFAYMTPEGWDAYAGVQAPAPAPTPAPTPAPEPTPAPTPPEVQPLPIPEPETPPAQPVPQAPADPSHPINDHFPTPEPLPGTQPSWLKVLLENLVQFLKELITKLTKGQ